MLKRSRALGLSPAAHLAQQHPISEVLDLRASSPHLPPIKPLIEPDRVANRAAQRHASLFSHPASDRGGRDATRLRHCNGPYLRISRRAQQLRHLGALAAPSLSSEHEGGCGLERAKKLMTDLPDGQRLAL
eukprot:scaffold146748_cov32-Tisochrysis_lutea.AAC.9